MNGSGLAPRDARPESTSESIETMAINHLAPEQTEHLADNIVGFARAAGGRHSGRAGLGDRCA